MYSMHTHARTHTLTHQTSLHPVAQLHSRPINAAEGDPTLSQVELNNVQHCCPLAEDHTAEPTTHPSHTMKCTSSLQALNKQVYLLSPDWRSDTMPSSTAFICIEQTEQCRQESDKHLVAAVKATAYCRACSKLLYSIPRQI